jgi:hypothetical protein
MVDRDPENFLSALTNAFHRRFEAEPSLKPQFLFYSASMRAVSIRLGALDALSSSFPEASKNAGINQRKRWQQDQILFDFFSNASAAFESFCCGSYFLGAVLDPSNFKFAIPEKGWLKELPKIGPERTLKSYKAFAPNSKFTEQLHDCLNSTEYKVIAMMRNLLVHRVAPGRIRQLSSNLDVMDLDVWFKGEVSRFYTTNLPAPESVFEVDDDCLARERDWIDNSIDGLAKELAELAKAKSLG